MSRLIGSTVEFKNNQARDAHAGSVDARTTARIVGVCVEVVGEVQKNPRADIAALIGGNLDMARRIRLIVGAGHEEKRHWPVTLDPTDGATCAECLGPCRLRAVAA